MEPTSSSTDPLLRASHLVVLRESFGHSKFRPLQWDIIKNILHYKRDQCVVMATGYGKSLCYQFPAVYCRGIAIVISPLISLMEDQTHALKLLNINACFLGSAQKEQRKVIDEMLDGKHSVVYMSPEFACGELGKNILKQLSEMKQKIVVLAIDEAHCVSQWGHDFRPKYQKLGKIRHILKNVPVLAVTATATEQVRRDICCSLKLINPAMIQSSFNRPNLYLAAMTRGDATFNDLRRFMKREDGQWNFTGPTIIYCPTKKRTRSVAAELKKVGIQCEVYNADLTPAKRTEVHQQFLKDQLRVVVATVAFGMGIDKPDIRYVIHYGVPKNIESYYQEIGRAGRDGVASKCVCFFRQEDFSLSKTLLQSYEQEHGLEMLKKLEQYVYSTQCRRRVILQYFGEYISDGEVSESCCDNCLKKAKFNLTQAAEGVTFDGTWDVTEDSALLMGAIDALNGKFGLGIPILFLRGSKSNRLPVKMYNHELYGKGRGKPEKWWKALGKLLIRESYLEESGSNALQKGFPKSGFPMSTVHVSRLGHKFLQSCENEDENGVIKLSLPEEMLSMLKLFGKIKPSGVNELEWLGEDVLVDECEEQPVDSKNYKAVTELYSKLLALRNKLALDNDCMPYLIADNKRLLEIAKLRPKLPEQLTQIEGFSGAKVEKFGKSIIEVVTQYCREHNLNQTEVCEEAPKPIPEEDRLYLLSDEGQQIYDMFHKQHLSVKEIGTSLNIFEGRVVRQLLKAIELGYPLDLAKLGVTAEVIKQIVGAISSPKVNGNIERLKPIMENCSNNITWDQLRIARAFIKRVVGDGQSNQLKIEDLEQFAYVPYNEYCESSPCGKSSEQTTDDNDLWGDDDYFVDLENKLGKEEESSSEGENAIEQERCKGPVNKVHRPLPPLQLIWPAVIGEKSASDKPVSERDHIEVKTRAQVILNEACDVVLPCSEAKKSNLPCSVTVKPDILVKTRAQSILDEVRKQPIETAEEGDVLNENCVKSTAQTILNEVQKQTIKTDEKRDEFKKDDVKSRAQTILDEVQNQTIKTDEKCDELKKDDVKSRAQTILDVMQKEPIEPDKQGDEHKDSATSTSSNFVSVPESSKKRNQDWLTAKNEQYLVKKMKKNSLFKL